MKRPLLTLGATALLAAGLYSSPLAAEGRADRMNEMRPYQNLDMMIKHLQAIHGPTAAGPGAPHDKGAMMHDKHMRVMDHRMHEDDMQGLTAHQRKRMVFGSNK